MRLAIVSVEKQWEIKQITDAAIKRGHSVKFYRPEDMLAGTHDFENFDAVLIRPIMGSGVLGRAIASAYRYEGTAVMDENMTKKSRG